MQLMELHIPGVRGHLVKQDVLNTLSFQTYCNINSTQRYLFKFICIQTVA
jgi:hypothetical protein